MVGQILVGFHSAIVGVRSGCGFYFVTGSSAGQREQDPIRQSTRRLTCQKNLGPITFLINTTRVPSKKKKTTNTLVNGI